MRDGAVLVVACIGILVVVVTLGWMVHLENICLDAGYPDLKLTSKGCFCAGVIDGGSVLVPLDMVRMEVSP